MIYKVWDIEHNKELGWYTDEKYANWHRDSLNAQGMTICVIEEDPRETP